ncbi:MAG: RsbRD N-terminal domain-containing protein [Gemmatimonadota bacterium]|nr:RsbRD N-terminal domain-containing protein [Gemmatimonadota bacterium]
MSAQNEFFTPMEARGLFDIAAVLRSGREEMLRDWVDRVRDNTAVQTGQALSEPLLLDHLPQLLDAIIDRIDVGRPREDAEQFAVIHGFARRLSGYNIAETVLELVMVRRSIWAHLTAVDARLEGAYAAMELIDGMLDRAIISSLQAFLNPDARLLERRAGEDGA